MKKKLTVVWNENAKCLLIIKSYILVKSESKLYLCFLLGNIKREKGLITGLLASIK